MNFLQQQNAFTSSELTVGDLPGGETHSAKDLGGKWAARTFRAIAQNFMAPSAIFALWTIQNREHPKGGERGALDYVLMREAMKSALENKQEHENVQIFEVNPLPKDFEYIETAGVDLIVGDVNGDRLELATRQRTVKKFVLENRADFPELENPVDVIMDFNQNGATLRREQGGVFTNNQLTLEAYLKNANKRLKKKGLLVFSGKLATKNLKEQGYQKLDVPDDVGNDSYYYHEQKKIIWMFAESGFLLKVPDGLVDELNTSNDGNEYELFSDSLGSFIIRKDGSQNGGKKPIFIVFAEKREDLSEELFVKAGSALVPKVSELVLADHVELDVAPGGIDLGYGKNIRMEKLSGGGDIPDSDDIIRLRQNLTGIVPVPAGPAVPLKEFLLVQH